MGGRGRCTEERHNDRHRQKRESGGVGGVEGRGVRQTDRQRQRDTETERDKERERVVTVGVRLK